MQFIIPVNWLQLLHFPFSDLIFRKLLCPLPPLRFNSFPLKIRCMCVCVCIVYIDIDIDIDIGVLVFVCVCIKCRLVFQTFRI